MGQRFAEGRMNMPPPSTLRIGFNGESRNCSRRGNPAKGLHPPPFSWRSISRVSIKQGHGGYLKMFLAFWPNDGECSCGHFPFLLIRQGWLWWHSYYFTTSWPPQTPEMGPLSPFPPNNAELKRKSCNQLLTTGKLYVNTCLIIQFSISVIWKWHIRGM